MGYKQINPFNKASKKLDVRGKKLHCRIPLSPLSRILYISPSTLFFFGSFFFGAQEWSRGVFTHRGKGTGGKRQRGAGYRNSFLEKMLDSYKTITYI